MAAADAEMVNLNKEPYGKANKQIVEGETLAAPSTCDRVTNVMAVLLLALVLVASALSVAAGASCLASLSGKPFAHFPLLFAFGAAPIVFGVFCLVVGVLAVVFISRCAMGLTRYGMCFAGGSRAMKAMNVCLLGVFPLLLLLVLLGLSVLGFSFFQLSRQLPPLDKDYARVSGITGPVNIMRDENGLVHIEASSRRDAYFGQGFAEAQDRLFQLEFYRLVGRGELASVVGPDGIDADKGTRLLNVRASAEAMCAKTKASDLKLMEAFADGVNYYLEHVAQRPVEFFFMSLSSSPLSYHEPKPFTTDDLCVVLRLLQWQLSSNLASEGQRFAMFLTPLQRTYEQVESLFNDFTTAEDTILTAEQLNLTARDIITNVAQHTLSRMIEAGTYNAVLQKLRPALAAGAGAQRQQQEPEEAAASVRPPQAVVRESLERVMTERFFMKAETDIFALKYVHASNAWAARDSMNRTVAASDPHLPMEFPSVWYSVHLSFPDEEGVQYDAAGVGMAGVPGVHIGRTTYASWGITMSLTDLEDLFVIANPTNPTQVPTNYTYRGKTYPFVPRRERIVVRGHSDVVIDVEDTLFGPIVNDLVGAGLPPSLKLALYAVPLRHDDNESVSVVLSLTDPTVRSAQQIMTNLLTLRSPGLSIPIADRSGNLAYAVTGRHPLRSSGHTGKYPSLSLLLGSDTYVSDDPAVPDRSVPPSGNPHFHSPADGTAMHISAANQKIYPEGYTYELGFDYAWAHRGQRLHEMLNALQQEPGDQLSNITRHMEIQRDIQSNIWVQDFRPIVAAFNVTAENAAAQKWHTRMMEWDAQATIGSVETAFFWRWLQSLSALPLDTRGSTPASGYVWRMLTQNDTVMEQQCGVYAARIAVGTNATSCNALAFALFARLANTDFTERWGVDLNHLTGIHKLLHNKIVRPVFERTIQKDGDLSSVCVSANSISGNMGSTQASSMRQLYDWSDPDRIYFSIPGGNSGNPYSPYYQNLLEKFGEGEYVRVAATARALEDVTSGKGARHRQSLTS